MIHQPPAYVKSASHDKRCGNPENLPAHVYGDFQRRMYPCHTKVACWLSALYLSSQQADYKTDEFNVIKDRILKAAEFFHNRPDVETVFTVIKQASDAGQLAIPDEHFGLVWVDEHGLKQREYPLTTRAEVKEAAAWFAQYCNEFQFADKHQIATKLLKRAHDLHVEGDVEQYEAVNRCAGFGHCAARDIADAWEKRATMCQRSHPKYSQAARETAATVRAATIEVRDSGRRVKMAQLLDQFDRETQLDKLYDRGGLERPEETLFKITVKTAHDFMSEHMHTTTGALYKVADFVGFDSDTFAQWMGTELADAVCDAACQLDIEKLADLVPTLPRDQAVMFDRMAAEARISPTNHTKAAAAIGMSDEERMAMAHAYMGLPAAERITS